MRRTGLTIRDANSTDTYILPESRPALTLAPAKPKVREDSPDDIVALDEAPASTTQQPINSGATTRKRGAPEDGDVAVGEDEEGAAKKRKLANGSDVIEID